MKLRELSGYLQSAFTFPVEQNEVIERIGSLEIEAPDSSESESIDTILQSLDGEVYPSAGSLFDSIIGNLSDEYIGRKFYDDRGGDPVPDASEPTDEIDTSF